MLYNNIPLLFPPTTAPSWAPHHEFLIKAFFFFFFFNKRINLLFVFMIFVCLCSSQFMWLTYVQLHLEITGKPNPWRWRSYRRLWGPWCGCWEPNLGSPQWHCAFYLIFKKFLIGGNATDWRYVSKEEMGREFRGVRI